LTSLHKLLVKTIPPVFTPYATISESVVLGQLSTMADVASETVGWYVWLSELNILPQEYQYIMRVISGFFVGSLSSPTPLSHCPLTRS
jgi:hypothetical protein